MKKIDKLFRIFWLFRCKIECFCVRIIVWLLITLDFTETFSQIFSTIVTTLNDYQNIKYKLWVHHTTTSTTRTTQDNSNKQKLFNKKLFCFLIFHTFYSIRQGMSIKLHNYNITVDLIVRHNTTAPVNGINNKASKRHETTDGVCKWKIIIDNRYLQSTKAS